MSAKIGIGATGLLLVGCGDDDADSVPAVSAQPAAPAVEASAPGQDETAKADEHQEVEDAPTVTLDLEEFTITPSVPSMPAGSITFEAVNKGSMTHEVVFLRTDLPGDALPLRQNGTQAAEEGEGVVSLGEIEEFAPGGRERLTLDLSPGRYLLLCNIPGHYQLGMWVEFMVTGAEDVTTVTLDLQEFTIRPSVPAVPAGPFVFEAVNNGSMPHEVVFMRTDLPGDALPLRENGTQAAEEGEGLTTLGEIEEFAAGGRASLALDLTPGRYLLLCNIPGHYQLGMWVEFIVT